MGDAIVRTVCARIPTDEGEFQLCHFANTHDHKEHLALIMGDVEGGEEVLVRVHSECYTGDVLASRRCDCGDQLQRAMHMIGEAGRGVIVYLRQEGRGIGLEKKLRAYNLQDEGYDTVEANLLLGHQADERDYWAAAAILADLGVHSVRLLTNNPAKIEHLRQLGVQVHDRIPLVATVHGDNRAYLRTKAQRMNHLLDLAQLDNAPVEERDPATTELAALQSQIAHHDRRLLRPFVTLSFAQSLDGSIAAAPGQPLRLSGDEAMRMTHALRASHDAILVGVGTVLADDPQLTVRLVDGPNPLPVVLDSRLRTPVTARVLANPRHALIAASHPAPERAALLEAQGATVLTVAASTMGGVELSALLAALHKRGVGSVMVEGGARVITAFLAQRLVDALVITIAPRFVGGVTAVERAVHTASNGAGEPLAALPTLLHPRYTRLGDDLMVWGAPGWRA